jgi:cell division protein ZapE
MLVNPEPLFPQQSTNPKAWYAQTGKSYDVAQTAAIDALDALWHQLIIFKNKRNHFLGRSLLSPEVPKGFYIWGGVGRGKTFLMDGFYACVPYRRKRRIHFHRFMAEVHQRMKQLAHHDDPLIAVSDSIAKSTRLLCLDEFHVDDIADAMLLGRLIAALFERGVILITTSNYPPAGLYPHGLQRQNFLPTIAMLEHELKVLSLGDGHDYRQQQAAREARFIIPCDSASEQYMSKMFVCCTGAESPVDAQQSDHNIPAKKIAATAIWFEFHNLCGGAHGQTEYLAIAHRYSTVFISGIPSLTEEDSAAARRFTWLIDVLYDHHVQLVASAACAPEKIYTQGTGSEEFHRTASRLVEMQSQRYMQLPHHTQNVNL